MKLILALLCLPVFAFGDADFIPIQERAQGRSLGAATLLNDSIFSNPASSSFIQTYSVEAIYAFPKDLSASVLDTKTSEFGAGLGYFRKKIEGQETPMQGIRLALSSRISGALGIGLAGKALWGPSRTGADTKLQDADFGLLARFDFAQIGFTLRNIAGGNEALRMYREWDLATRLGYQETVFFSAQMTSKWDNPSPYQIGFGAEYVSPFYFALKGGYRFSPETSLQTWSAGLSFLAPHLSLHYAAEFPNELNTEISHTLSAMILM